MEQIDITRLPKHIAIIMDGNGRWATMHHQDRLYGHAHGVDSVRRVVDVCCTLNIQYLTLYAFSIENWDRPTQEVSGLMELFVESLRKEIDALHQRNVRVHMIGNINRLPANAQQELKESIDITQKNTGLNLIIAISYGARWEIANAAKQIAIDAKNNKLDVEMITDNIFQQYLCTKHFPDPELMIRTSGEHRISNFLLYQLAYTELYFTETLWPDFGKEDLYKAIIDFQQRQRRFGKTSDQLLV